MSTLQVWRLCAAEYGPTAFSGEGARLYGGRWSPAGIRIAYCSESRALAIVEVLANADEQDRLFARKWVIVGAEVPYNLVERPSTFPDNWRHFPHPLEPRSVGADWAKAGRSAALRVPSAIVSGEFNYLLNPAHPNFVRVKILKPEAFTFDPRLGS